MTAILKAVFCSLALGALAQQSDLGNLLSRGDARRQEYVEAFKNLVSAAKLDPGTQVRCRTLMNQPYSDKHSCREAGNPVGDTAGSRPPERVVTSAPQSAHPSTLQSL